MSFVPIHTLIVILGVLLFLASIKPLRVYLGVSCLFSFSVVLGFCLVTLIPDIVVSSKSYAWFCVLSCIYGCSISFLLEFLPSNLRIVDCLRGTQFSEQFAPELGNRDSYLETYSTCLVVALFFETGLFQKSLSTFILLAHTVFSDQLADRIILDNFILLVSYYIEFSMFFIFPVVLFTLLIELSMSLLQKMYPKLQIGHELTTAKNLVGMSFVMIVFLNHELYLERFSRYSASVLELFQ